MNLILKLLISALAVFILSYFLPGVTLSGNTFATAFLVAVILGLLNILVKPILILLTFPITIMTLGLFLLVVNALMIMLADKLIDNFSVNSIWTAILFSILLSILQSLLNSILKEDKK